MSAPKEYPEREIFAYGRYIQCQILNWSEGPPPQFIICNPLDARYREEFIAHQAMGTWAQCDLRHVLSALASIQADNLRLRKALEPFALKLGDSYRDVPDYHYFTAYFSVGQIRAAARALFPSEEQAARSLSQDGEGGQ